MRDVREKILMPWDFQKHWQTLNLPDPCTCYFSSLRCLINSFGSQFAVIFPLRGTYGEITYTDSTAEFTIPLPMNAIIVCLLCKVSNVINIMSYGIKQIFPSDRKYDGTPLRLLWGYMGFHGRIHIRLRMRKKERDWQT